MRKFLFCINILFIILLSGCHLSDQILADKMLEKYSDNENYVTLEGEIIEYSDHLVTIKSEELYNSYSYYSDICHFYIYSTEVLDLYVEDIIYFKTVIFPFYNGHRLPIVEITKNTEVLLDFEQGKENLFYCVSNFIFY